jgi:hypothetical protein
MQTLMRSPSILRDHQQSYGNTIFVPHGEREQAPAYLFHLLHITMYRAKRLKGINELSFNLISDPITYNYSSGNPIYYTLYDLIVWLTLIIDSIPFSLCSLFQRQNNSIVFSLETGMSDGRSQSAKG